ncbi:SRPBCC family protein [Cytobacillus firmus]|uniref:SRPBCC family protein n=1 Tax=Cytobacillus firmus TaxID=1399 RepID=UPI0018CE4E76|nr:SRPBCC family protein [Cytobacillus firmus]MBG9587609.1 hypothetical protein [Cytobacillus firmus]
MIKFQNKIDINRTRDEVYSYLTQLENFPVWNYALLDISKEKSAETESYIISRKFLGKYTTEIIKVKEQIYPQKFQLETISNTGPFNYKLTYYLEEGKDKTTLINNVELSPNGIFCIFPDSIGDKIQNEVLKNLIVLKNLLENYSKI